jgi:DNA-binding response OmpR family regulator
MGIFSRRSIHDLNPRLVFDELVKRTRILVIDDKDDEFPFEFMRKQGYSIDHWKDVIDLGKLEAGFFDIIILDIGGVGTALDASKEGIAVLTHIKRVNPSQVVVAYSGQSHESSKIDFFRLADAYVSKPATAIDWKERIDDLVRTTMTTQYYWGVLRSALEIQGVSEKRIKALETELARSGPKSVADLQDRAKKVLGPIDNLATLLSIVAKLAKIALA